MIKKLTALMLILIITVTGLCACGDTGEKADGIQIVCTVFPYYDWARNLTKEGRVILGLYMWDYGNHCPIDDDVMKFQLDIAYEKMLKGQIEGVMLHSSNNSDIGLSTTGITKQWVEDITK